MFYFLLLITGLHSILWQTVSSSSFSPPIAKPNCLDDCGGVKIPYPFGIGPDCFHHPFYEIFCNHSFIPSPKPFLKHYDLEVIDIKYQSSPYKGDVPIYQMLTVLAPPANVCESNRAVLFGVDLGGSPYSFSNIHNVLRVEGCSGNVVVRDRSGQIVSGCTSFCANSDATINLTTCHGVQCCQSKLLPPSINIYMDYYNDTVVEDTRKSYISTESGSVFYEIPSELDQKHLYMSSDFYEIGLDYRTPIHPTNTCTLAAALIDFRHKENITRSLLDLSTVPTVLQWHVDVTYLKHKKKHHIECYDVYGDGIQSCTCRPDYIDGNPYLPKGCHRTASYEPVEKGCEKCKHHCAYNETSSQYYCKRKSWLKQAPFLGFSTAMGLVLLVLGCYWLYRFIQWRREIQRKAKYFKKNGGLLLKQQMSSSDGVVDKMTIFSVSELEKSTDNFHENRILGQGGQGTVYKGMLMDGRIVAIKKATEVDENQLDQFINEVVILSHINHRNVVKLLGCCLETEIPLLVYEFIPNGTLYQHIHDPTEDFHLAWKMRLQIAAESAGVLSYLHSSSSAPIYHRDIKSSNILLDEKFRAKVSDFGTSRAINIDQTHVTTRVQGTYGYLDPEYFQSNQFNEKSDVYSFGVVLVELITGKKPVRFTELGGWKSLATEFLCQMENSDLFDIVDTRVIDEGKAEQFVAVADLARQCLNMNGKERPTMKEVAMVLDRIKSPNRKEQTSVSEKCMVTEIYDSGPRSTQSTDMFFTANGSFSSMSIEAQPLMFSQGRRHTRARWFIRTTRRREKIH